MRGESDDLYRIIRYYDLILFIKLRHCNIEQRYFSIHRLY